MITSYCRYGLRPLQKYVHAHAEHHKLIGPYRTHYINQIVQIPPGTRVRVCGRVSHIRPLGHINFILLTDHEESVQAVWKKGSSNDLASQIKALRPNSFCSLEGIVTDRHEILLENCCELSVPDSAITRWPIQPETSEEVRLKLRFLDLREPQFQKRLKLRSRAVHAIRSVLQSLQFSEIETPILTASSPEGAREFLVPTRKSECFFALAQSPQQYKLLMAGGFERYFQFARCFRDEDGRRDRQSEFTQIDIEMAYVGTEEIMHLAETTLRDLSTSLPEMQLQFPATALPRYSYDHVIQHYGSDKPDLRTKQMALHDISDGWIAMLCKQVKRYPLEADLKGVITIPVTEHTNSTIDSATVAEHIIALSIRKLNAQPGDCVILSRDRLALGCSRNKLIPWLHDRGLLEFDQDTAWLWVTEFPLFERGPESTLQSCHHPFTAPVDVEQLYNAQYDLDALLSLKAQSYDLVVNGMELGGGSIRIHDYNVQKLVLSLLNSKQTSKTFQALLSALRHGCPPHGGIALGFDRIISEFPRKTSSLRDVIAFPKSAFGRDLMMDTPGCLYDEKCQLSDLGIQLRKPCLIMNK